MAKNLRPLTCHWPLSKPLLTCRCLGSVSSDASIGPPFFHVKIDTEKKNDVLFGTWGLCLIFSTYYLGYPVINFHSSLASASRSQVRGQAIVKSDFNYLVWSLNLQTDQWQHWTVPKQTKKPTEHCSNCSLESAPTGSDGMSRPSMIHFRRSLFSWGCHTWIFNHPSVKCWSILFHHCGSCCHSSSYLQHVYTF